MKKLVFSLLALLISVPSTWALGKGTCSLTADVLYSNVLNVSNVPNSSKSGVGGYITFDYQFLSWMALGVDGGLKSYTKNGVKMNVESLDLMGRLLCPNCNGAFVPYLIGGAGFRPLMKNKANYYQGNYHAMAGIGGRLDFTGKNPGSGLDIALVMDAYSPKAVLMKTGDVRVGYTFAFGGKGKKAQGKKKTAAKTKPSATPAAPQVGAEWWPKPFSAPTAYAKLKNELVPSRVSENKLDVLNSEVKPFFAKLKETGVKDKEYNDYCAGYFTALAVGFNKKGDTVRAQACLDKALKFSPEFKEALELRAKMAGNSVAAPATAAVATTAAVAPAAGATTAAVWWPTPFVASTAYAKLKTEIVPARVKANQLNELGKDAKPFFAKLLETGVKGQEFTNYKVGYYTAIGANLLKQNDKVRAEYYVDNALKVSPSDKDALAVKAQIAAAN